MKRFLNIPALAMAAALALSSGALAYTVVPVANGGAISGTVSASGAVPKAQSVKVTKNSEVCGKMHMTDKYDVKGGKVQWALVYLEGVKSGKAGVAAATLSNSKCRFAPHVQGVTQGAVVTIKNADNILHNTHLRLANGNRTLLNSALPKAGVTLKSKPLTNAGLVSVTCDAHSFMQGYIYVSDNPYFAVTNASGAYSITGVPPGTYKVTCWQEAAAPVTKSVTVKAKGAVKQDFAITLK